MTGYLLRRVGASLLLLLAVLTLTFFFVHAAPGEPTAVLDVPTLPREAREHLRRLYGLDRPLGEQYVAWLRAALSGDLGVSYRHQEPALEVLLRAFPNTLALGAAALLVSYTLALPLGIAAARRRGSAFDHGVRFGMLLLYSLPLFWTGLLAILLFSHVWPILPAGSILSPQASFLSPFGRFLDFLRHLLLPALVLGAGLAASTTQFVRTGLVEVLQQDYLTTARAKGLTERRVVWLHALRNALPPIVHLFGLTLPALLNGSLVVEVVFSWPGIGRLTYDALLTRDYPLILASVVVSGTLVIAGNLLADLLHAAVDPRVRHA